MTHPLLAKNSVALLLFLLLSAGNAFAAHPQDSSATPSTATESSTAPTSPDTYNTFNFVNLLRNFSNQLDGSPSKEKLSALRASLPQTWIVTTPEGSFPISTEPLRNKLLIEKPDQAKAWLAALSAQILSYSTNPRAPQQSARAELDRILAGSEFSSVRPPSAWDRLRARINAWLERMLMKIFSGMARYPMGAKILFWGALFACICFIAFWLIRYLVKSDRLDPLPTNALSLPSRSWQEWIRAAREAANRGDHRAGIHAAYWAGIVRLQDLTILPKDRTKTPREYLRLLTTQSARILPQQALREPLSSITTRMEKTWYARQTANADDFRDALKQLEALGCPLE